MPKATIHEKLRTFRTSSCRSGNIFSELENISWNLLPASFLPVGLPKMNRDSCIIKKGYVYGETAQIRGRYSFARKATSTTSNYWNSGKSIL